MTTQWYYIKGKNGKPMVLQSQWYYFVWRHQPSANLPANLSLAGRQQRAM
jgi:hypothetical protein